MEKRSEKRPRRPARPRAAVLPELAHYRRLRRELARAERLLAEYGGAAEEFGLYPGSPALADPRPIHCSTGPLPPALVLARAQAQAARAERLTEETQAARRRLQTRLLQQSRTAAEYRALCRRFLPDGEET